MPTVVAVWPNNTISIIRMWREFTMVDLFSEIDHEGNPFHATCYLLREDSDGLHITFDWKRLDDGTPVGPKSKNIGLGRIAGKIKKLPWPDDIEKQWFRQLERDARHSSVSDRMRYMSASELPKYPSPPQALYTADEVRQMKRFCGVYLAYDSDGTCHYVGESENVPCRVSKSRSEIGDRMIGIVSCSKHERRLIEAYFVSVLNPAGNGISTHRMKASSSTRNTQKEAKDGPHADDVHSTPAARSLQAPGQHGG
jgi:hypothetical protein